MVFGAGAALKEWLQVWILDWLQHFFEDVKVREISSGGLLELHDLHLRSSLLPPSLPLSLDTGTISRVDVEVSLLKLSMRISVGGVRVRLRPQATPRDAAQAVELAAAAQLEAVQRALEAAETDRERASSRGGGGGGIGGMWEYLLGRLITRIVHNIDLKVEDVAIEMLMEAPAAHDGDAGGAALGLVLDSAHVVTTDSNWHAAADTDSDSTMFKVIELAGLGLYIDPLRSSDGAGSAPAAIASEGGGSSSTAPAQSKAAAAPTKAEVPPASPADSFDEGGDGPRKVRGLPPDQPFEVATWWRNAARSGSGGSGGGCGGGSGGNGDGGGSGDGGSSVGDGAADPAAAARGHRWVLSPLSLAARLKIDTYLLLHAASAPSHSAPADALLRSSLPRRFLFADASCSPVLLATDEWQVRRLLVAPGGSWWLLLMASGCFWLLLMAPDGS